MNMRPPTTTTARTVYEDFTPLSEWKQEQAASLLLIHLPGFTRDHIRVTSEPSNIIKVRGERPLLTNNKWARFNQDYAVPQDCTLRGVRAKLDAGTLTITMPNKIINQQNSPPKQPTMDTKKEFPQKLIDDINKTAVQNPPAPKKESPFEPKSQKFIDDVKKKIMDATTPTPPKVEANKIEQDKKNMHTSASTEKASPTSLEDMMKNIVHTPKDNKAEADESNKNQKSHADIAQKEKEKDDKGKEKVVSQLKTKLLDNDEESAEKTSGTGGDQVENFNKMVQGLTLRIKEDRESLVNVGVAVLILLALGIYVSH